MTTLRLFAPAFAAGLLAVLSASPLAAQQSPTATEATAVYDETHRVASVGAMPAAMRGVFTRLGEANTAVIPFVENRRMGIIKKPVELTGTLRYARKNGLSLAYESPKPRVLIIDDQGFIERQPDGRERRMAAGERPELTVLTDIYLNLLRGRPAGMFGACDVYFAGNSGSWQIGLIPKDESLRRRTGRVLISGAGREIATDRHAARERRRPHAALVARGDRREVPGVRDPKLFPHGEGDDGVAVDVIEA